MYLPCDNQNIPSFIQQHLSPCSQIVQSDTNVYLGVYVQASISNHAFFLRAFPLNTNRAWMLHIPSVCLQRLFLVIRGDYHIPVFWVETFLQRGGAELRGEINLFSKEDNFSCICFSISNLGWDPQNDGEKHSAFLHQKFPLSVMKENLLLKLDSKKRTLVKF